MHPTPTGATAAHGSPTAAGARTLVAAFVGQLHGDMARGRWICACEPQGHYAFPRNAWTDGAVRVIRARKTNGGAA